MAALKKLSQKLLLELGFLFVKEVKGKDNIPAKGGFIVASNHASYIDPLAITSAIFKKERKIIRYIGKKEALENIFFRFLYQIFDVIAIDSSLKRKALNEAVKTLANDGIIGIFPEGARTSDGIIQIQSGKTGVARLAIFSKKPLLPVAIKNTYILWPVDRRLPKIKRIIRISIGKPMSVAHYNGRRISKKLLRSITDSIMERITELYKD